MVEEKEEKERESFEGGLHSLMELAGVAVQSSQDIIGEGAKGMIYQAGKKYGRKLGAMLGKQKSLEDAIEKLREKFKGAFEFTLWKKAEQRDYIIKEGNTITANLVFYNCIIRDMMRRVNMPKKNVFCNYMIYGIIAGALEVMVGAKYGKLDVLHSGETSCLKKLVITLG